MTLLFAEQPELAARWLEAGRSIIAVTVADEAELGALATRLGRQGTPIVEVREPDFGYELCSVGIAPPYGRRATSELPLLGRTPPTPQEAEQARKREHALRQVVRRMEECEQTEGQSVLAHGRAVWAKLSQLLEWIRDPNRGELKGWRLPSWLEEHGERLVADMEAAGITDWMLERYTTLHDCGKPYCLEVDEEGRRHFPNHAEISQSTYLGIVTGGDDGRPVSEAERTIAELILSDMDVHLLRGEDVEAFAKKELAPALLLTALAEIHANADMFGGTESVGFKSKWKHIDRRGRAIGRARWRTGESR